MSNAAFTELLRGKGAHADPMACVEDLPTELAARQVAGFPHSISQLVFHMNYWMDYERRRVRGEKPKYPEHSAESFPAATSEEEWDSVRTTFGRLLADFAALAKSSRQELERTIEPVHEGDQKIAGSLEAVLWQMVAHNSYHIGQVAMMRRMLGAWPPRSGGDSW